MCGCIIGNSDTYSNHSDTYSATGNCITATLTENEEREREREREREKPVAAMVCRSIAMAVSRKEPRESFNRTHTYTCLLISDPSIFVPSFSSFCSVCRLSLSLSLCSQVHWSVCVRLHIKADVWAASPKTGREDHISTLTSNKKAPKQAKGETESERGRKRKRTTSSYTNCLF